jgi:hypothetical protein
LEARVFTQSICVGWVGVEFSSTNPPEHIWIEVDI